MDSSSTSVIIALFIVLIVFMVLREFWCWYFKINRQTVLLEEILEELKCLNKNKSKDSNDIIAVNNVEEKKQESEKTL